MKSIEQIFNFSILKTFTAIVFLKISLFSIPALSQFQDTFTDNDFDHNPTWWGNTSGFVVTDGVLRLDAGSGITSAYLVTNNTGSFGTWEWWTGLAFNPSGANYVRVYLTSNASDLAGPLQGYFVMIGGATDEISLYRQSGTTRTKIIDGTDGRVNFNDVSVHLKVTRSQEGEWVLYSRVNGEEEFFVEGEVRDVSFNTSVCFGIQCVFTSTRSDKFFFDDFSVTTTPYLDPTPPIIDALDVSDPFTLRISFSKEIDHSLLSSQDNYNVNNGIGKPREVIVGLDNKSVVLIFDTPFLNGRTHMLTVIAASDLNGNTANSLQREFVFIQPVTPSFKDVIITEIFPDPTPPVALPESEFVEILNRSQKVITLEDWILTDGPSKGKIPFHILHPGDYLILSPQNAVNAFQHWGTTVGVPGFPSLNNASDAVILKDPSGATIDSVRYTDQWYRNSYKKAGGWSLELIDPNNLCAEEENWIASEHGQGGTPGNVNSVYAEKPDLTGPKLLQVIAISPDTVELSFDEKLENKIPSSDSFGFSHSLIAEQIILDATLKKVKLVISPSLSVGTLYEIMVSKIYDCAGNIIQSGFSKNRFALSEKADSLDVIINEILFNPRPGGADFIEVWNLSGKYINLKNWKIGNFENGFIQNAKVISAENLVLGPEAYLAFSPDPENILNEYPRTVRENLVKMVLPSFNDKSGSACIVTENGLIVDQMSYTEGMHSPFLRNKEGVSLERISRELPAGDPNNWRSASSESGFATPGEKNSNAATQKTNDHAFTVNPEIFIPLYGQPDFTSITYSLEKGGMLANIRVVDSRGLPIKTIAQNSLLGTNGLFRWDGDRDDGNRARIGSYMILIELFDKSGSLRTIRKRVAIAGTF